MNPKTRELLDQLKAKYADRNPVVIDIDEAVRAQFAEEVADLLLNGNLHAVVDELDPDEFERWVKGTTASRMRVVAAKAVRMLAAGTLPENARVKP